MNTTEAILNAFYNLQRLNENLYSHWLIQLYDAQGAEIQEEWTPENLKLMEQDVEAMSILFSI